MEYLPVSRRINATHATHLVCVCFGRARFGSTAMAGDGWQWDVLGKSSASGGRLPLFFRLALPHPPASAQTNVFRSV